MELSSEVGDLSLVGPIYQKRLERLGVRTIEDLLLHVPKRYEDFRNFQEISSIKVGENVTIKGKIESSQNIYTKTKKVMQEIVISDRTGKVNAVWFNQPYLIKTMKIGDQIAISGKVGFWGRKVAITSPIYERIGSEDLLHTGRLVPVYPQTSGISSKWLRRQIKNALDNLQEIPDFLPENIIKENSLLPYKKAIKMAHYPSKKMDWTEAIKRLAFNEMLKLQLESARRRLNWEKENISKKICVKREDINSFIKKLPFTLTESQKKSVEEILEDLDRSYPMNRLLEGDVGSGKTIVAAIATYSLYLNKVKSLIMAPTQILANQHFQTFKSLFKDQKVKIALLTSTKKRGEIEKADIIIGTHSLLTSKKLPTNVYLIVIDEQQRFGVEQRKKIVERIKKGGDITPHVLTMTATPIPRTVALTAYGDLSLSTLTHMPQGRKRITTWLVPIEKRGKAYKWMEEKIRKENVQSFVVCPLIEESETESMESVKAAKKVAQELKNKLKTKTGIVHGKMKVKERDKILKNFVRNKVSVLVSTPIVEVGIDISNATIMVIEAADRFGLAQLHQLRGRVGRGEKKSYCLLFTESESEKVLKRLSAMKEGLSGFELSELDLKLRGPGEFFGTAQSGFPRLKIANWADLDLIKKTKDAAKEILAKVS